MVDGRELSHNDMKNGTHVEVKDTNITGVIVQSERGDKCSVKLDTDNKVKTYNRNQLKLTGAYILTTKSLNPNIKKTIDTFYYNSSFCFVFFLVCFIFGFFIVW